jgi:hypothetical protein
MNMGSLQGLIEVVGFVVAAERRLSSSCIKHIGPLPSAFCAQACAMLVGARLHTAGLSSRRNVSPQIVGPLVRDY